MNALRQLVLENRLSPRHRPGADAANMKSFDLALQQSKSMDIPSQTEGSEIGALAKAAQAMLDATTDLTGEKIVATSERLSAALKTGDDRRLRDLVKAAQRVQRMAEHPYPLR